MKNKTHTFYGPPRPLTKVNYCPGNLVEVNKQWFPIVERSNQSVGIYTDQKATCFIPMETLQPLQLKVRMRQVFPIVYEWSDTANNLLRLVLCRETANPGEPPFDQVKWIQQIGISNAYRILIRSVISTDSMSDMDWTDVPKVEAASYLLCAIEQLLKTQAKETG